MEVCAPDSIAGGGELIFGPLVDCIGVKNILEWRVLHQLAEGITLESNVWIATCEISRN